jgi:hypothetical protein
VAQASFVATYQRNVRIKLVPTTEQRNVQLERFLAPLVVVQHQNHVLRTLTLDLEVVDLEVVVIVTVHVVKRNVGALVKSAKQLARVAPQPVNALNHALEKVMAQTLVRKLSPLECVMEKKTQGKDVVLIRVVVLIIFARQPVKAPLLGFRRLALAKKAPILA